MQGCVLGCAENLPRLLWLLRWDNFANTGNRRSHPVALDTANAWSTGLVCGQ